jgi:aryl carrier-like protein
VHEVCLVRDHTIPKTTSGKLMRFATKQAYVSGNLVKMQVKGPSLLTMVKSFPSKFVDKAIHILVPQQEFKRQVLQKYLATKVAEQIDSLPEEIYIQDDLRTYGMDSVRQMQLLRELEDRCDFLFSRISLCENNANYRRTNGIIEFLD